MMKDGVFQKGKKLVQKEREIQLEKMLKIETNFLIFTNPKNEKVTKIILIQILNDLKLDIFFCLNFFNKKKLANFCRNFSCLSRKNLQKIFSFNIKENSSWNPP